MGHERMNRSQRGGFLRCPMGIGPKVATPRGRDLLVKVRVVPVAIHGAVREPLAGGTGNTVAIPVDNERPSHWETHSPNRSWPVA